MLFATDKFALLAALASPPERLPASNLRDLGKILSGRHGTAPGVAQAAGHDLVFPNALTASNDRFNVVACRLIPGARHSIAPEPAIGATPVLGFGEASNFAREIRHRFCIPLVRFLKFNVCSDVLAKIHHRVVKIFEAPI